MVSAESRLVAEALASIDARVLRGRCLPYGEGITYWPVIEVLEDLDLLPADQAAARAIRSLTGKTDSVEAPPRRSPGRSGKTLEQAAVERRFAVVFDDIQWGEGTFLDLVEHVALFSAGAPILVVCMARSRICPLNGAPPGR